jgi:hypothetical protein
VTERIAGNAPAFLRRFLQKIMQTVRYRFRVI